MTDREAIDVLFNEWKCIDRNDGIHCDRKCESCDLVMDVGIIREAFNMAISALQAQEEKTQLSEEGTTSDLISRQAAIALANSLKDDLPDDERMVDAVMAHNEGIMEYQTKLSLLPSAHPEIEERKEESAQNVPKEDLISRKVAIDAMSESLKRVFPEHRQIAEKCLKALPSAQPERKKGKWIKLDMHAHLADHKCTACGQECYVPTCMGEPMYTYCPNCGADMRGDDHDL